MKKKLFLGIRGKILLGFISLVVIFGVSAVYNIYTIYKSKSVLKDLYENKDPYLETLKDLELLVSRSKMYTTNWVYLRKNEKDKTELKKLLKEDYPKLKTKIEGFVSKLDDKKQEKSIHQILTDFELLSTKQQSIMAGLSTFESYEDPLIKFDAEETLESAVIPMSENILTGLASVIKIKKEEKTVGRENLSTSYDSLVRSMFVIGVVMMVLGVIASIFTASTIVVPINKIKLIIEKLGNGEQPEKITTTSTDEVGQMTLAVNQLSYGLANTSKFAENIGNGNLDAAFEPLSDKDILGNALIEMRKNLKKFSEEEKKRNWATEGLAKFSEILRSDSNVTELCHKILASLVKYVGANQGGIFILQGESEEEQYFELVSSYAYDRKKFQERRIEMGEGLVGQCYLEKETIFLTDVPDEYVNITSGLGMANPTSILIVPLKINDTVEGVLELASFKEFDQYEISFIEKLAENICSSISGTKINERTHNLLKDSQMLTEQLRAQEEEMRQNLEELMATQEESRRKEIEYINRIAELEK